MENTTYKKITDDVYLKIITNPEPEIIKVSEIQAEIASLELQLTQLEAPSEAEIIAMEDNIHPYYLNKINIEKRIEDLNTSLAFLSEITEEG